MRLPRKVWPYIVIVCISLLACEGIILLMNANKRNNTRAFRPPQTNQYTSEPVSKEVSRNNNVTWVTLKEGRGINTYLLTYDGCQYIMVYSGDAMTMVKHEPPKN